MINKTPRQTLVCRHMSRSFILANLVFSICLAWSPHLHGSELKDKPSGKQSVRDSVDRKRPLDFQALSQADAILYRQAFTQMRRGKLAEIYPRLDQLSNPLLVGVMRGQNIVAHPKTIPPVEIKDWMNRFHDLPIAQQVAKVGRRVNKSAFIKIKSPKSYPFINGLGDDLPAWVDEKITVSNDAEELSDQLEHLVDRGDYGKAIESFQQQAGQLDSHEQQDWVATQLATRIFNSARDEISSENRAEAFEEALELVIEASRSAETIPQAPWLAGLLFWQSENYELALEYFILTANSPAVSPWSEARASYWAARANIVLDEQEEATEWLNRAAERSNSFYGQLAAASLQSLPVRNWKLPEIKPHEFERLESYPAIRRARALLQIGEKDLADLEIRATFLTIPASLRPLVLSLVEDNGMPGLALRLATALERQTGEHYDAGFYPDLKLHPKSGYRIDPALLHSFARLESRFNPNAKSPKGAHGLMQIMPTTAQWLSNKTSTVKRSSLDDPRVSLDLAQRLIGRIFSAPEVKGNLIYLAIAYNGGRGMLGRSQSRLEGVDDPLLYIESLVAEETRLYVKRILNSYWLYQAKLGEEPTSLNALARGEWPV
ncbi:MAG: transglycosylase SLT domain-containing protein, partial [Alphaproteobacteria bacterium]|nr:transglycosylase SLT domain-containing protein [Alphaproteobacteria bacterium]